MWECVIICNHIFENLGTPNNMQAYVGICGNMWECGGTGNHV